MKRGRNQRRRQGVNINRAYDSNGPEVRIRGTANQIYDKYLALARDASSSGDRVKAENYYQHAEHYFRVIRSMQAAQQQPQIDVNDGDSEQPALSGVGERERPRDMAGADFGEAPETDNDETPVAAAEPRPANGHADQADGQRRQRRRRPRRGPRPEGEDSVGESEETAEVAAS